MDNVDWPGIGTQMGFGFVVGLAVGYAVKKTLKVALFVIGLGILLGAYLEHYNFITINWGTIEQVYSNTLGEASVADHAISLRDVLQRYIPVAGGFGVGFIWGLKRG